MHLSNKPAISVLKYGYIEKSDQMVRAYKGATSVGQKLPFTEKQIEMIDAILEVDSNPNTIRNRAILRCALDTMLRGTDLLSLKVSDISFGGEVRAEFSLRMKKTKRTVKCQLLPKAQVALKKWLELSGKTSADERIFPITLRHYSRIVKSFAEMLRLDPAAYSTHSLRRTKPSIIYAKTKNIAAVKRLLGHSDLGATSAYLGVDEANALDVAKEFEL